MSSRTGGRRWWWSGRARNAWTEAAQSALSAAFLDMDSRQSIAEAGVTACEQLYPAKGMGARWEPVRLRCYEASARYLTLSGQLQTVAQAKRHDPGAEAQVSPLVQQLRAAAQAVDEFYRAQQETLEQAAATLATVPQLVAQTRASAAQAQRDGESSPYRNYPSVQQTLQKMAAGLGQLDAAASPADSRDAAIRVDTTVKSLARALEEAPGRDQAAAVAISSVSTRITAARTRADKATAAYSALLREFNAASSADLKGSEQAGRELIEQAASELTRANRAISVHNPELALESTASARSKLTAAETKVDAVTNRLALLRQVRATPTEHEKAVRFRLRDAQMLAVGRGLTSEWGSVLDAQVERIDRIATALTGPHPDYWAYVTQLEDVTRFIAEAVEKIKKDRKR